jgi:hypothetical protein
MNFLDSIDKVDWASVHHAFGIASDIPPLLQKLLSPQQEERQDAIETLDDLIHHQGTLYEAAVYVAPIFLEMLKYPEMPDKENIVASFALLAEDKPPETYSANERPWAQSLKSIIEQNIDILYPYLQAKEPAVRWMIAYSIALFPQHRDVSLPFLEQAFNREEKKDVKDGIENAVIRLKNAEQQ